MSERRSVFWSRLLRGGLLVISLILIGMIIGFWFRRAVDIEACLDFGGRWNYTYEVCDLPAARER